MLKTGFWIFAVLLTVNIFSGCGESDETLLGDWKQSVDFSGSPRAHTTTFVINNKLYVVGGYDYDDYYSDVRAFDPVSKSWTKFNDNSVAFEPFPGEERYSAVGFSINGKGYMGTGYNYDDDIYFKDFWEFDPSKTTGQWNQIADFPGGARSGCVAFSLGNLGYVGTGYKNDGDDKGDNSDFYSYSPETNTWSIAKPVNTKRHDAVVFVIGNYAYLGTGMNNSSYINDFQYYNPETNEWTMLNDLDYSDDYSIERSNAVAFTINGYGYIGTGYNGGFKSDFWKYNPSTDTWDEVTGFEGSARSDAFGFSYEDYGYVGTGRNGTTQDYVFDNFWQFDPTAEYDEDDN